MPSMKPARERRYRDGLRAAADAGAAVLRGGGSALEAVTVVNVHMEDSGVFNAGLGSCLTSGGAVEMDAAVMDGSDRGYGAVAGVKGVANPIVLARRIMEDTPHCILGGAGAVEFARAAGLRFRDDFPSPERLADWTRRREAIAGALDSGDLRERLATLGGVLGEESEVPDAPVGATDTVGVIAVDSEGHLAAGASTGGIWMKLPGRIGDSPLIGAGIWALDGVGAAVATGTGESIMRVLMCREVVDAMPAWGAQGACERGVGLLQEHFGTGVGGVVGVGPDGRLGYSFNTRGMGRSAWRAGMDEAAVAVWSGEDWDRPVTG